MCRSRACDRRGSSRGGGRFPATGGITRPPGAGPLQRGGLRRSRGERAGSGMDGPGGGRVRRTGPDGIPAAGSRRVGGRFRRGTGRGCGAPGRVLPIPAGSFLGRARVRHGPEAVVLGDRGVGAGGPSIDHVYDASGIRHARSAAASRGPSLWRIACVDGHAGSCLSDVSKRARLTGPRQSIV